MRYGRNGRYARQISKQINSGIYLGPTQGLSSPKNNRRACLCTDKDTYSRDCCNGNLIAQGVGVIQGTPTPIVPTSTTTSTTSTTSTSTSTSTTSTTSTSTSTSTTTQALYPFVIGPGGSSATACNNAQTGNTITVYANAITLAVGVRVFTNASGTTPLSNGFISQGVLYDIWFVGGGTGTIQGSDGICTALTTSTTTSTSTSTTSTSTTSTSTSTTSTTTAAPLPIVTGSLALWTSYGLRSGSTSWPDRSGNGNTALISGSTLAISGSGVGQDFGLKFNGTNNFLTYPAPLGGGNPSADWSVQMYGTWDVTSQNLDFFAHNDYQQGWDIALTPDSRTVVRTNPSPSADFNYTAPKATLTLVTITFDGTNSELKLYANTTLIGTIAQTIANWSVSNLPFQFGWNENTDATYFAGTVREITLYKKVLTSGEITTNYNVFTTQP